LERSAELLRQGTSDVSSSIDPLATLIASVAADPRAVLIASVAAVILSVFCALLVCHQQRRLTVMQAQLDKLSGAFRELKSDHERLFIRSLNSPRARMARKSSSPSSNALGETVTVPTQPAEENSRASALYTAAPKTSPE
jgi:uncharacterized membrane protein (DUF106 family)